jgi:hypothetical protein
VYVNQPQNFVIQAITINSETPLAKRKSRDCGSTLEAWLVSQTDTCDRPYKGHSSSSRSSSIPTQRYHPSLGVLPLDLGSYCLPSLHQLRRCPQPLRYIQSSLLPSARSGLNPHSDGVVQDREGLSSAFGLMSLDDSEVLAGLVNDAPFFDNAITNDSSSSLNPS